MRKILLLFDSGVVNIQTPTTNSYLCFQYTVALLTAVTSPEVTWCCENPFDVLAIGDGVGCCEQSGAYRLVLH